MLSVKIRSRIGNVVLIALGVTYALTGVILFIWSVVMHWGAASLAEYALFVLLAIAITCGVWFARMAAQNLGIRTRLMQHA